MKEIGSLKTFIINLPSRTDRLAHVKKEFAGRDEFDITIIEAISDKIGNIGLWNTMQKIVRLAKEANDDFILICEDDHQFTTSYNKQFLFNNILEAKKQGAHILSGGISGGFSYALPLTKNRIWLDIYFGNQFIIIYKAFFDIFLNKQFDPDKTVDVTLSLLTMHKMTLFPFISTQKNFGYSDVTQHNVLDPEDVPKRFANTSKRLEVILKIYSFYY
jgi:GR25 family glycosyltransferase involved in LPS biosynthesis